MGGKSISKKSENIIGYMPENTPVYNALTVREYISFMAELKGVQKSGRKAMVEELIKKLNLADVEGKIIKNISRGYRQRVSLAGALVGNPEIIILDEPTVGLDPKQVIDFRNLINSLKENHTIILSSHILSEISQVCERVIIINKGKVVDIVDLKKMEAPLEEVFMKYIDEEEK